MPNQRLPSTEHGRRDSDVWARFGRTITVVATMVALVATFGKAWDAAAQIETNKVDVSALAKRIDRIERVQNDGHYMACYMFQRVNPEGVPSSCDLALRRVGQQP